MPEDGLKRLFKACAGNTFEARRETALLMMLLDTGARRDEMAGLKLSDIDLELDVPLVLGKGRRERTLPFGRRAGEALDRYLRARARHKDANLPWLCRPLPNPEAVASGCEYRQAFERARLQAGALFAAGRSQAEVAHPGRRAARVEAAAPHGLAAAAPGPPRGRARRAGHRPLGRRGLALGFDATPAADGP